MSQKLVEKTFNGENQFYIYHRFFLIIVGRDWKTYLSLIYLRTMAECTHSAHMEHREWETMHAACNPFLLSTIRTAHWF